MRAIHNGKGMWFAARLGAAAIGVGNWIAREATYGRLVARKPWQELLGDYDPRRGRLWPLVLSSIAAGPGPARRNAAA